MSPKLDEKTARKSVLIGLSVAIVPVFLTWIQLTFIFLINPKFLKLSVYNLTMLMPVMIEMIFSLLKVRTGIIGIYVIAYIFHFLLISTIVYFYLRNAAEKGKDSLLQSSLRC